MSIIIFEMQMRFYVRVFANEDWQSVFSENKLFHPGTDKNSISSLL
jgi:hypothetical protein